MKIEPMNNDRAVEYINWKYDAPYEFYNTPENAMEEAMAEITSDNGDDFYSVINDEGHLFGIYDFSFPNGIMEIGLGIRPESCGMGNGRQFVKNCIEFGRNTYKYNGPVKLMVADFNERAVHLYLSLGFKEVNRLERLSYGKPVKFILMELVSE